MADLDILNPSTEANALLQGLHQAGQISIFKYLTAAQIADVQARTCALDLTTALQTAINSGDALWWPRGTYRHDTMLSLRNNGYTNWRGDNYQSILKCYATMTYQVWRDGVDVGGATVDAVFIEGMEFNANRNADWCARIGASKSGALRFRGIGFKVGNLKCGDDSGAATARFYENVVQLVSDGDINFAGSVATMPLYGIYGTDTATDNQFVLCKAFYISEAGQDIYGGSNMSYGAHSYGDNTADTGPKYNVRMRAPGRIIEPHCDNVTVAGVKLGSQNIDLVGGLYYWAPDNTPANAPTTAPVPVEVDSGVDTISIHGGTVRGANSSNPSVRWLGTRAQRASIWGMSPMYRYAGDKGQNTVERSIGITRSTGFDSVLYVDTATGNKAIAEFNVNGAARYRTGTDGTTESGSNAGSKYVMSYFTDAAVETNIFTHFRASNSVTWTSGHQFNGNVGFYGTTPIAKQTGTPANATDLATAITLVNALKAQLIALGLTA